jgi:hypothetical protein
MGLASFPSPHVIMGRGQGGRFKGISNEISNTNLKHAQAYARDHADEPKPAQTAASQASDAPASAAAGVANAVARRSPDGGASAPEPPDVEAHSALHDAACVALPGEAHAVLHDAAHVAIPVAMHVALHDATNAALHDVEHVPLLVSQHASVHDADPVAQARNASAHAQPPEPPPAHSDKPDDRSSPE